MVAIVLKSKHSTIFLNIKSMNRPAFLVLRHTSRSCRNFVSSHIFNQLVKAGFPCVLTKFVFPKHLFFVLLGVKNGQRQRVQKIYWLWFVELVELIQQRQTGQQVSQYGSMTDEPVWIEQSANWHARAHTPNSHTWATPGRQTKELIGCHGLNGGASTPSSWGETYTEWRIHTAVRDLMARKRRNWTRSEQEKSWRKKNHLRNNLRGRKEKLN